MGGWVVLMDSRGLAIVIVVWLRYGLSGGVWLFGECAGWGISPLRVLGGMCVWG